MSGDRPRPPVRSVNLTTAKWLTELGLALEAEGLTQEEADRAAQRVLRAVLRHAGQDPALAERPA